VSKYYQAEENRTKSLLGSIYQFIAVRYYMQVSKNFNKKNEPVGQTLNVFTVFILGRGWVRCVCGDTL